MANSVTDKFCYWLPCYNPVTYDPLVAHEPVSPQYSGSLLLGTYFPQGLAAMQTRLNKQPDPNCPPLKN